EFEIVFVLMYLIDGYNLLHAQQFDNKEELINAVNDYCYYRKKRALIVFDGYCRDDMNTDLVQVTFLGDADEGIIDIMDRKEASSLILVTSDREILAEARKKKISCIKSEDFNLSVPEETESEPGEDSNFFMSDHEAEEQLKEFNNFKK
ncbi:hypothetical protein HOB30_02575, partial [Candidatus Falkowbacteria bacterium]|nr:hypothetical protein [Candidatus Falkowbacteria bacterium]